MQRAKSLFPISISHRFHHFFRGPVAGKLALSFLSILPPAVGARTDAVVCVNALSLGFRKS